MSDKNARWLIGLVVAIWLLSSFVDLDGLSPQALVLVFVVIVPAIALGILLLVLHMLAGTGWRALSMHYREVAPFRGTWQATGIARMAPVSMSDPEYRRRKGRFFGTLRMGATADALYLTTIFSRLPLLQKWFPTLQIPLSAVEHARIIGGPDWSISLNDLSVVKGKLVEMKIGSPPVFLQLPAELLGDLLRRLPFKPAGK